VMKTKIIYEFTEDDCDELNRAYRIQLYHDDTVSALHEISQIIRAYFKYESDELKDDEKIKKLEEMLEEIRGLVCEGLEHFDG